MAMWNGVTIDAEDLPAYKESWKRSKKESIKFINYVSKLKPKSTDEMVKLNEARNQIIFLGPVLAGATQTIQVIHHLRNGWPCFIFSGP